jgi:HlyD family secretion protein
MKKARFALEQGESKRKILIAYTMPKRINELKRAVEIARSDELAKKATWERERSKESALEREVIRSRAGAGRFELK